MASPLPTAKQTVNLASSGPRVSRIRRDPPPKVKEVTAEEVKERETIAAVVGVIAIALAMFVILLAFSNFGGWDARNYTVAL